MHRREQGTSFTLRVAYQGGNGLRGRRARQQLPVLPAGAGRVISAPAILKKVLLSLSSDMLEAAQDLTGSSPWQSHSSALLLSLLLFIQELLLLILPVRSLFPLPVGTLTRTHAHCLLSGPSLGVPVPLPD